MSASLPTVRPPLIGDSPALDLANTHFNIRTTTHDGIATVSLLDEWLTAVGPAALETPASNGELAITTADVFEFHELRDAVRAVLACVTDGEAPPEDAIARINRFASASPAWREIRPREDGEFDEVAGFSGRAADAIATALAADFVTLLTGSKKHLLRACHGPNCPLYFLHDHPRRQWCSPACGTRARAARAYARKTGRLSTAGTHATLG